MPLRIDELRFDLIMICGDFTKIYKDEHQDHQGSTYSAEIDHAPKKHPPLPRNQDKAQALQSWLHETAPARKEAFEQVRAPRGLIRQMGR